MNPRQIADQKAFNSQLKKDKAYQRAKQVIIRQRELIARLKNTIAFMRDYHQKHNTLPSQEDFNNS